MSESKVRVCRLCFSLFEEYHVITELQLGMLQIILPELKVNLSDAMVICLDCKNTLEETFTFKSKFLEMEDNLHGYKDNSQEELDLKEVIGINDILDDTLKNGKICRICLQLIDTSFQELNKPNNPITDLLKKCLPEMDIRLTKNPVICQMCIKIVEKNFNFVILCQKNEEKIKDYSKTIGPCEHIDLYDVVRYTWSKEGQNMPSLKTEDYTIVKDEYMTDPVPIKNEKDDSLNRTSINININRPKNDIYVISDDDDDKFNSLNVTNKENSDPIDLLPVFVITKSHSADNIENMNFTSNGPTPGTSKKTIGSSVAAVEMEDTESGYEVVSDNCSIYSTESEKTDSDFEDTCIKNNTTKRSKSKSENKGPPDKRLKIVDTIEVSDSEASEDDSVHSIASEDSDVISINSEASNGETNKSKRNKRRADEPTKKAKSSLIELCDIMSDDEVYEYLNCEFSNCTEEAKFIISNMVKIYKCTHCAWETVDKRMFDKHFQQFKGSKIEEVHLKKVAKADKIYSCLKCLFHTYDKHLMNKHLKNYHIKLIPTSFRCSICYQEYKNKWEIKCHPGENPLAMYKCPFCTFQFDHKSKITPHVSVHHRTGNFSVKYGCKLCFTLCSEDERLTEHVMTHKKAEKVVCYKCLKCSYKSTSPTSIKEHIRKAHRLKASRGTGDKRKPHSDNLNAGEDKVYQLCPFCKRYIKKGNLKQHIKNHKYLCDVCPFNASSQEMLDKHELLHTRGEAKSVYTCQMCFSIFSRYTGLLKHTNVHKTPTSNVVESN